MVMTEPGIRSTVTEAGGVQCLLKAVIAASSRELEAEDEKELLSNLFDSLCKLMLHPAALEVFRSIKGIPALLLMLRLPKPVSELAMRAIDVALQGSGEVSGDVVGEGGLKIVFPLLLRSV